MPLNRMLPDSQVTLPLDEIQGDILIGLKKNAEVFVFFEITDVVRFRQELGATIPLVTFSDRMKAVEEAKQTGAAIPVFLGLNIAFTADGLRKLHPGDNLAGLDPAFVDGAAAARQRLADRMDNWMEGYHAPIDGALLATGVDSATAANHADAIVHGLRHSIRVVRREPGLVRSGNQKGHEHFGFADGISQPGVRGLTQPGPDPDQGLPGQDLIQPGEFVFGHPDERGQVAVPRPWMRNGSYLVFRRLRQDVPAFHAYMAAVAPTTNLITPERLGAHLIGRWASGAPTVLTPVVDNLALAEDPGRNNDFEFGSNAAADIAADPHQEKCPFVSHIRKMYPREDFNDANVKAALNLSDAAFEDIKKEPDRRRIIRAGIPFGRDEDADKGLLFACYQTSITDKFEFLQITWANNPGFMFAKQTCDGQPITPGLDITIGQGSPRTAEIGGMPKVTLPDAPVFVENTGAVYLFSPSRSALVGIAAG